MPEYEILASGFKEVKQEYHNKDWKPEDPEVRERIKEIVEEKKKENSDFYNGPLVRVAHHELKEDDKILYLELENTSYFDHVGTRQEGYDKKNRADPLSVGARITASYGGNNSEYLVLGEKSSLNEIGSGEFQIPCGFVEDHSTQFQESLNAYPASPVHREIKEEIGLLSKDLPHPVPKDLIGAVDHQPMLIYDAEAGIGLNEVAAKWMDIPNEKKEFSRLTFLPVEDIEKALEKEKTEILSATTIKDSKFRGEITSDKENISLRPHAKGALDSYYKRIRE